MGSIPHPKRFIPRTCAFARVQVSMPAADAVEMYAALMNFTGSVHPQEVDKVNQVGSKRISQHVSRNHVDDTLLLGD
jgi:hypothetical protein